MFPLRRIAILSPNWLGDAIMSLPLVGFLSSSARVQVMVWAPAYISRVYSGLNCVSQVLTFPYKPRKKRLASLVGQGRILGIEGAVVLPPSWSSALAALLSGVPKRIGYATEGRSFLLSGSVSPDGMKESHVSSNYVELGKMLLDSLGLEAPCEFAVPSLRVFREDRDRLERILTERSIPLKGFIVIVPGAAYGVAKAWPADKFRELSRALSSLGPVILSGTTAEKELCRRIADGLENVFNLAGDTGLGTFFSLLDRAEVVVANDSGAPHAASSLGTPAVTIFGSTSPTWTRPLGERVIIVKGQADCSPCFLRRCPYELQCFEGISTDRVYDEVKKVLEKKVDNLASSM